VDRNLHGKGVGKGLMQAMENDIKKHKGTRVYIETSGRPDYIATRKFYEACGYTVVSTIPDFYAPGDDRLTYARIF
jgi:ribosomal protein S18 acetylase RimI-like enzyme